MLIKSRAMVQAILLDRPFLSMSNDHYWERHVAAVKSPKRMEVAILGLINSVADYIDGFARANCGVEIAGDPLACEYLEPAISAIANLLNYDTGRLNGGVVSDALGYLRMCLQVGSNSIGTTPSKYTIKKFAALMWEVWNKNRVI